MAKTLRQLREDARACQDCTLWANATQTVFGLGDPHAGVDREHVYITNAVKHFKWQLRGKRRLHKTPAQREIDACHQWLAFRQFVKDLSLIKKALTRP